MNISYDSKNPTHDKFSRILNSLASAQRNHPNYQQKPENFDMKLNQTELIQRNKKLT